MSSDPQKAEIFEKLINPPKITSHEIHTTHLKMQQKFTDPTFPPNIFSLIGKNKPAEYKDEWDQFVWKRPEEVWPNQNPQVFYSISPNAVEQGFLGDSYFTSALSLLAETPQHLTRLLTYNVTTRSGVYGIWLHLNGRWQEVVVDDLFPVYSEMPPTVKFAFSHSNTMEFWVQLFEKAYAKAYGSYYAITGGSLSLALGDLTGAPCEVTRLDRAMDIEETWRNLVNYDKSGFVFCFNNRPAATKDQSRHREFEAGRAFKIVSGTEFQPDGKPKMRLIKIRNQWSKTEIEKIWPEARIRWSDKLKEQFGELVSQDRSFWLPIEVAVKHFDELVVCKVGEKGYYDTLFFPVIKKCNTSHLNLGESAQIALTVSQEDLRSIKSSAPGYLKYCYVRLTVMEVLPATFKFVRSVFGIGRNVCLIEALNKGNFAVLVELYIPANHQASSFNLEVFSSTRKMLLGKISDQSDEMFMDSEIEAWRSFMNLNLEKIAPQTRDPNFTIYLHRHAEAYLQIEAIKNNSSPDSKYFVDYERMYKGGGLETNPREKNGSIVLHPNPQNIDLALLKHDPFAKENEFNISGFLPVASLSKENTKHDRVHAIWLAKIQEQLTTLPRKLETTEQVESKCGDNCRLI